MNLFSYLNKHIAIAILAVFAFSTMLGLVLSRPKQMTEEVQWSKASGLWIQQYKSSEGYDAYSFLKFDPSSRLIQGMAFKKSSINDNSPFESYGNFNSIYTAWDGKVLLYRYLGQKDAHSVSGLGWIEFYLDQKNVNYESGNVNFVHENYEIESDSSRSAWSNGSIKRSLSNLPWNKDSLQHFVNQL